MPRRPTIPCSAGCGRLMWKKSSNSDRPMCLPCRSELGEWWQGESRAGKSCVECDRPVQARGRCHRHYQYMLRRRPGGAWSGGPYIPRSTREAVYERDGWICQLCDEPVDPALDPQRDRMGATLDHIVCVSWSGEPDNSESNLRLAHRACNSSRGNRDVVAA